MTTHKRGIGIGIWAITLLGAASLQAGDWPQWRGPASLGISAETGLPARWSPTENVAWKAALAGIGASSPIVTGGIVVVTSQIGSYADPTLPLVGGVVDSIAAFVKRVGG